MLVLPASYPQGTDQILGLATHSNFKEDKTEVELAADPELLEVAVSEAGNYQAGRVIVGKISSSNNWNRQIDRIRFLHEKHGSSCEEMETHAAAHICRVYDVPFLGIRILSNTEIHGEDFNPATGTACQQYVLTVIKSYAERKVKEAQSNSKPTNRN